MAHAEPQSRITLHASTIALPDSGKAAIIRGASGSGKSSICLSLIALGACLVADDRTILERRDGRILATCPPGLEGLIEARGVGLLKAPTVASAEVCLIVDLDSKETQRLPDWHSAELLGLTLPMLHNPGMEHFPAAILLYLRHGRQS